MTIQKATFDDLYAAYSPAGYVQQIVSDLTYELPFMAMNRLKPYTQALLPQESVRVTIVGSGHGLDVVALKYNLTPQEVLTRWTDETTIGQAFPNSDSGYEATLIDIQPEPLRFARDVNLADKTFVANLGQPYSRQLSQHFAEKTDMVTAVGVTTDLG